MIPTTHRTTGFMLKAIGDAILQPNTWVEFEHDVKPTVQSLELWRETLESVCSRLELSDMEFRVQEGSVWVLRRTK